MQKTPVVINFAQGIDTKTDPYQLPVGEFLTLNNVVFDKAGGLVKRNGFPKITEIPNALQTNLTTLNDNLIATGSSLYAFSQPTSEWINQGNVQPVGLDTLPLVRAATAQTNPDMAVTASGLTCLVYVDTALCYYQIIDSATSQSIVLRTALPSTAKNPRVFILGQYFIITFTTTTPHLQYIAIPIANPDTPGSATDISTDVVSSTAGYDAVVANNTLYVAWAATTSKVKYTSMSAVLTVSSAIALTGSHTANLMSVTASNTASLPIIWITFWDSGSTDGYTTVVSANLASILAPTKSISATSVAELTSVAANGVMTLMYQVINNYNTTGAYPTANIRTDYLSKVTVTIAGVVGSPTIPLRSVGLASKAFFGPDGNTIYMMAAYGASNTASNQCTYFLINSNGNIFMRLAYANGGGYAPTQVLPSLSVVDDAYLVPYSIADFLAPVNKGTGTTGNISALYTRLGVNLAKFVISDSAQSVSEVAGSLNLTGGLLWQYDGHQVVENNFNVWMEDEAYTTQTTGGAISPQIYYYVFCYEWTDNQGNLQRSAPSIPMKVDLSGTGVSTNTNSLFVPTLRLTYKNFPNPINIIGYRWSTAQPVYYQFTVLATPQANALTVDYVTIFDGLADASILGQTLLYTTGGVIENIAPPASIDSALYQNRLMLIDAEDQNLIWYSKQVIEATPVEFSDLFTFYVAPTTGAQGSTGKLTCISAMDDKFIMFKRDAIYYLTGKGPDNTGANNDFSDPIFITSSVGCSNPRSIVLMPNGLMFQSDKGIWLLGRDLSTTYIGDRVELYNNQEIVSALTIPGTNQVRFALTSGTTLMYDYYYNKWGTFSNLNSVSDTLYQGMHTYLNEFGQVFQETSDTYLDGTTPVLISFQTGWLNLAGLRGFERFYYLFLLGTYFTPFKLNVQLAYNYNSSTAHSILVSPDNYAPNWGDEATWGSGGPWGGVSSNVFQAKVDAKQQKCQTFQISVNELYDSTLGVPAGEGLSLSGMTLVVGGKKGWAPQKGSRTFG